MSEYTSYSSSAMSGGAGAAVVGGFSQQGISFRDVKAWTTARERAEVLAKNVENELRNQEINDFNNSRMCSVEREYVHVEAMLSAFSKVPEFREYAQQAKTIEFQGIKDDLKASRLKRNNFSESNNGAAKLLRSRLEKLAGEVQEELCRVERKVMSDTTSSVLKEMGYLVERKGGLLKGSRGLTCIWAEVNQFGDLSMDMSGFSGLACVEEMHRIENKLKERGVDMKRKASQSHYRPEGGVLVQKIEKVFPEFKKMKTSLSTSTVKEKIRQV